VQENTIEAVCNLISDVLIDVIDQPNASSFLRDLRSRRFHCGALYGDQATPADHDISSFNFRAARSYFVN